MLSHAVINDLGTCLCCADEAPLIGEELCQSCDRAYKHRVPLDIVGQCPECPAGNWADLYQSRLLRSETACVQHITLATARVLPELNTTRDVSQI